MPNGKMIVCDGGNGAGKSTVMAAIERHLREAGRAVVLTREPGGTPIGERIREILLSPSAGEMCDLTELLLFAAARAQHLQEKILPALRAGMIVLSDRFDSATVSFQHHARGLPLDIVARANALAVGDFRPDLTLVLDLDPVLGLARVGQRGLELDRIESEKIDFLRRARDGYLAQAAEHPALFRVIDASRPLPVVIDAAIREVDAALRAGRPGEKA